MDFLSSLSIVTILHALFVVKKPPQRAVFLISILKLLCKFSRLFPCGSILLAFSIPQLRAPPLHLRRVVALERSAALRVACELVTVESKVHERGSFHAKHRGPFSSQLVELDVQRVCENIG